jgi:hypothetical protein
MKTESHVGFGVYEFGNDPSIVTGLVGFAPTKSWLTGEPWPNYPKATRRNAGWEFQSPLPLEAHVEEHIEALLRILEVHAQGVRKAIEQYEAEIQCAIYYYEEHCNQGFQFVRANNSESG